jgi:hypothetical protein
VGIGRLFGPAVVQETDAPRRGFETSGRRAGRVPRARTARVKTGKREEDEKD